jgi:hypothetical protein
LRRIPARRHRDDCNAAPGGNRKSMTELNNNDLAFIPLGGTGEIGMNFNV